MQSSDWQCFWTSTTQTRRLNYVEDGNVFRLSASAACNRWNSVRDKFCDSRPVLVTDEYEIRHLSKNLNTAFARVNPRDPNDDANSAPNSVRMDIEVASPNPGAVGDDSNSTPDAQTDLCPASTNLSWTTLRNASSLKTCTAFQVCCDSGNAALFVTGLAGVGATKSSSIEANSAKKKLCEEVVGVVGVKQAKLFCLLDSISVDSAPTSTVTIISNVRFSTE